MVMNRLMFLILIMTLTSQIRLISQQNYKRAIHSYEVELNVDEVVLSGTLLSTEADYPVPLVVFISGSGPTDRDGNQGEDGANSIKLLAEALAENDIASLRFDKRGVAKSPISDELKATIKIEDFIHDIEQWVHKYEEDERFSKIIIAGHSLGSLQGILAAQNLDVAAFISIAGSALPLDQVILNQLNDQFFLMANAAKPVVDSIKAGHEIKQMNPHLERIFPTHLHGYLHSMFQHDPAEEISKLNIPVCIIQGNHDIQVPVQHAELLHKNYPEAEVHIVEGMSHVLKNAPADRAKNIATYSDKNSPLNSEFVKHIIQFILNLN